MTKEDSRITHRAREFSQEPIGTVSHTVGNDSIFLTARSDAVRKLKTGDSLYAGAPAAQVQQLPFAIEPESLAALRRFYECALDGEGHDVPASTMKALAGIGLVQRRWGSYYETTKFGLAVLDGKFTSSQPEAAKAAKDTERLDWLDENIFSAPLDDFDKKLHPGMWAWRTFAPVSAQGSARNIIDAAKAHGEKA